MAENNTMDKLVALCKRRGFVYPASEIYGGLNGFWDYGPLGAQLKNNIRDDWWRNMVECPPVGPDGHPLQIVGLDSAIIQNPNTWVASGHVGGFNDPMVDCTESKKRYREDQVMVFVTPQDDQHNYAFPENQPDHISKKLKRANVDPGECEIKPLTQFDASEYANIVGPDAKIAGTLTEPRLFNLMFETFVGAIRNDEAKAYLRPETAQGIFLNYKNVLDTMRVKMPFGIAQIGKSFRNEVTPRNFIFRSREFEQMEMEWFCAPDEALDWYEFWKVERMKWWKNLGIAESNLRYRDHDEDELAHYSKACVDVEYKYPFTDPGFGELEGVAHRGCFDLTQHEEHSRTKMQYFDQERQLAAKEAGLSKDEINARSKYIPNVIEPASGLTRAVLVMLCEAYTPDPDRPSKVFMKFLPKLSPVKAGILPLVAKDGMPEIAEKLYYDLRDRYVVDLDVKQNIGKRYARQDEIGTPFCFTIDGQTKEDDTVTVRYRDTLEQDRIHIDKVKTFLADKIGGE
ncbi:MAG: glycine--tRNA ligase [Phycisphaerae bacterium]